MNVIIIQPPLVQLNTPYPSGAYLKSFFKNNGHNAVWYDLSIRLVHRIFSRKGLSRLFELTEKTAMEKAVLAEKESDYPTAENLRRYIGQSNLWIQWIDFIMNVLCGKDRPSTRELCHRFVLSPHSPRGKRMEDYINSLGGIPTADDARNLAAMAIADIADYISFVFDAEFSLVRYAESITVGETAFSAIEKKLDSPVLEYFYSEILDEAFNDFIPDEKNKTLVCISVPFAGTFTPALFTARYLKRKFGNNILVSFGGGFVNTELRDFKDPSFSKYADCISYDRGYGSYKNLLDLISENKLSECNSIYKMRFFKNGEFTEPLNSDKSYEMFENEQTVLTVPDYSDIDFTLYPRLADDTNPMQRLWSDGAWIKAYLAHGCYWHKCSFCDVTLDYVFSYRMTDIENLFNGLKAQSEKNGIYGIHFVDEAMPPSAMMKFSELNMKYSAGYSFWGNVRFEKIYSRDMADFLSFGGLIGVSGGIEIATGSGLDNISKGTDIDSIVSACCAFKEAGILVHAYMIYGYFSETDQDTINSMETLRQLYSAGLLDSCFWHKFVLTRHSRIYDEWRRGLHSKLNPYENTESGVFARNALHFKGEKDSEKFGDGLNESLQSWMHGKNLNKPVEKWFRFKVPHPSVPSDFISKSIERYEKRRNAEWKASLTVEKLWWLGGKMISAEKKLLWTYMQEDFRLNINLSEAVSFEFTKCLDALSPEKHDTVPMKKLLEKNPDIKTILRHLRGKGLVML